MKEKFYGFQPYTFSWVLHIITSFKNIFYTAGFKYHYYFIIFGTIRYEAAFAHKIAMNFIKNFLNYIK